jgi:predicted transcriptional regulator
LAAVEANIETLTADLRELNVKTDRIVERVGDKVEQLIRDGVIRAART